MKGKTFLLILVPILIVSGIWGFLAYNVIVLGNLVHFSAHIWPLLIAVFIIYFTGLFFWYKIEQSAYKARIEDLEMETRSILSRIETLEIRMERGEKKKGKK